MAKDETTVEANPEYQTWFKGLDKLRTIVSDSLHRNETLTAGGRRLRDAGRFSPAGGPKARSTPTIAVSAKDLRVAAGPTRMAPRSREERR